MILSHSDRFKSSRKLPERPNPSASALPEISSLWHGHCLFHRYGTSFMSFEKDSTLTLEGVWFDREGTRIQSGSLRVPHPVVSLLQHLPAGPVSALPTGSTATAFVTRPLLALGLHSLFIRIRPSAGGFLIRQPGESRCCGRCSQPTPWSGVKAGRARPGKTGIPKI